MLGLVSGLLVADGCRRRGDLPRALKHLATAQIHLLRLARLAEGAFQEWVAPERGLARDLCSAAYARYREVTARLDESSIKIGIARPWRWGRELASIAGARPLADDALARLDDRLCGAAIGD